MTVEAVVPIREPSEEFIAAIREELARAERGELKSFAFVAEYVDGMVVDQVMYEDGANAYKMIGAIEALKAKIITRYLLPVVSMTTIAWDGTTLAADTRCTFAGVPVRVKKLWRFGDHAYAATGDMAESVLVAKWIEAGMPDASRPRCEEAGRSGILVNLSSGEAFRLIGRTGLVTIPIHEPFEAMGSGCEFATAALAMGKTAAQAVKFAMRFDVFTGGPIESVRVKRQKR